MSDHEGCWPEQEEEQRRRASAAAILEANADRPRIDLGNDLAPIDAPTGPAVMRGGRGRGGRHRNGRGRDRVFGPPPTATLHFTAEGEELTSEMVEAMQRISAERQREEDEEHKRITDIRVFGFMLNHNRSDMEEPRVVIDGTETPEDGSTAVQDQTQPMSGSNTIDVTERATRSNQAVASVNIELAREVERLEREKSVLQSTVASLESEVVGLRSEVEACGPVIRVDQNHDVVSAVTGVRSTIGAESESEESVRADSGGVGKEPGGVRYQDGKPETRRSEVGCNRDQTNVV